MTSRFRTSRIHTVVAAALVVIASAVPTLHAQQVRARIQVPFAFDYGSQHCAPGVYTLDNTNSQALLLHGESTAAMIMYRSDIDIEPATASYAVFRKYGDRYFLQELWTAGSIQHLSLYEFKWEKEAAHHIGRHDSATTVPVAFLNTAGTR